MFNMASTMVLSCICFGGFFIQGITGFGANLFTMSCAILLFPRNVILPICLLFTFLQTSYISYCDHKDIDKKQFCMILTLAMVFGMPLGALTVNYLNEFVLKILLTVFIYLYSGNNLLQALALNAKITLPNIAANQFQGISYILPILSGAFETAFGTGGPLIMAYLSTKIYSQKALRATVSLFWTVLNSIILVYGVLLTKSLVLDLKLTLFTLPGLILGQILSGKVSKQLSYQKFCIVLHSVLIASATLILLQMLIGF